MHGIPVCISERKQNREQLDLGAPEVIEAGDREREKRAAKTRSELAEGHAVAPDQEGQARERDDGETRVLGRGGEPAIDRKTALPGEAAVEPAASAFP
jgi:hypothetical protein